MLIRDLEEILSLYPPDACIKISVDDEEQPDLDFRVLCDAENFVTQHTQDSTGIVTLCIYGRGNREFLKTGAGF